MPAKPESSEESSSTNKELVEIVAKLCDIMADFNSSRTRFSSEDVFSAAAADALIELKVRLGHLSRK